MKASIVLDISRLLWRAKYSTPSGIDRVEMAYAEYLLANVPERVAFAAMTPFGLSGRLPTDRVADFLSATTHRWQDPDRRGEPQALAWRLWARATTGCISQRIRRPARSAYLLLSHTHLQRVRTIQHALKREQANLICFVHDLIPVEYPEFARAGDAAKHVRRMDTVARHAKLVLVNSDSTRHALESWMERRRSDGSMPSRFAPPVILAPLGISVQARAGQIDSNSNPRRPYFLVIGTLEPRKNHLFLLQLWRRMVEEEGASVVPRLVLVGRRGWENENLLDMLERCVQLRGVVTLHQTASDAELSGLLENACALLFPSFAEGYGLPLAEALAMGVPALCSDVAALREVGGDAPEYFDPQDGPSWRSAVRDYAEPRSPRRTAQLDRLSQWRAPSWTDHFNIVMPLIDEVCV
jgi:glycosyltransferase involved in cell wall biosynthesis